MTEPAESRLRPWPADLSAMIRNASLAFLGYVEFIWLKFTGLMKSHGSFHWVAEFYVVTSSVGLPKVRSQPYECGCVTW